MSSSLEHVTFDCEDATVVAGFWAAALGFEVIGEPGEAFAVVGGPATPEDHPLLMFSKVPEGKTVKNRVHFDLQTDGELAVEVERLTELGAAKVADKSEWGHTWVVMQDPEGNEFCVSAAH